MEDVTEIEQVIQALRRYDPERIILFGSYARGDLDSYSDIDIVLDKYYIPARYPDALAPPAVPYKLFTITEARQALSYAEEIASLVKARTQPRAFALFAPFAPSRFR